MDESEKLRRLRELLLEDDRAAQKELDEKVEAINDQISDHDKLVDTLYPIIGKAIKKYIRLEMQVLSEKIDAQLEKAFSWKGWARRIKGWFGGTKESQLMLRDMSRPNLEEMFVIERNSGILKGSYSRNSTVDKDMIAGMLTAIKAFVEDAFKRGGESLEMIEYESYKILLYDVQTFYVAVVCSGILTAEFKAKLQSQVLEFISNYLAKIKEDESPESEQYMTRELKEHFDDSVI